MFYKKLKAKVVRLEAELLESKNELERTMVELSVKKRENEWLQWQIDNPPKYNVGDKIGELTVTKRIFIKPDLFAMIKDLTIAFCFVWGLRQGYKIEEARKHAAANIKCQWQYELFNATTGKIETKKELELSA